MKTRCWGVHPIVPFPGGKLWLFRERKSMPLITVIITLIVVGILLWLVNTYIPMDGKIKNIINIVVVLAVIFWLCKIFGLIDAISGIRVGK